MPKQAVDIACETGLSLVVPMETFNTEQAAKKTGASMRQLQWWSEHNLVRPKHEGHRRIWIEADLEQAKKVLAMRKVGLSLHQCRAILRSNKVYSQIVRVKRPMVIQGVLVVPA